MCTRLMHCKLSLTGRCLKSVRRLDTMWTCTTNARGKQLDVKSDLGCALSQGILPETGITGQGYILSAYQV